MKFITEQYETFENGELIFSEAKIRKATLIDELVYSDRLSLYERRAISEQQEENLKLKEENEKLNEDLKELANKNQKLKEKMNDLTWENVLAKMKLNKLNGNFKNVIYYHEPLNKLNQDKWDC